jgi:hypothetical protein
MIRVGFGVLVLLTLSCGYRFTSGGVPFPEGIRHARVGTFANRTAEPGLEVAFSHSLREQLARSGALGGSDSEASITGEILTTSYWESIRDSQARLTSYRLSGTAILRLVKNQRMVSEANVSGTEEFLANPDPLRSENNRAAALRRLADTLMRDGLERLATGF